MKKRENITWSEAKLKSHIYLLAFCFPYLLWTSQLLLGEILFPIFTEHVHPHSIVTQTIYGGYSNYVTAAIFVFQNNEATAMLMYKKNPVQCELNCFLM